LAVATLLTLVFLPALYVTWFRIKRPQPDASKNLDLEHTAMASH
jgi:multidrug efflux pump